MPAVYILVNKTNHAMYIGSTKNLNCRTYEHLTKAVPTSFSARYNTLKLVYFELYDNWFDALKREHQLKNWHREWKNNLVKSFNPTWENLIYKLEP